MTLFKQVALLVSFVFLLIIITTIDGDFRRSSSLVEGQMQTSAQDMATMLGIAISNSGADADIATYETLFNAVFDSGYYSSIILTAPDDKLIHGKVRELEVQGVPAWFIKIVPLSPATGVTQVMQGWVPLGTLRLTLHPGYVYTSLYKNLEANLMWFGVMFFVSMLVLWLLLHQLLMPLREVKKQADAIQKNKFVTQPVIPRTVELRRVVQAMNRMVVKVNRIFDDQEVTLTRYQKLLYEDGLTGLGNREYFMSQIERIQSEESDFHGSLAVVKLHNIEEVRAHAGYKVADVILIALANVLQGFSSKYSDEKCSRLSDDEFAVFIATASQSPVESIEEIFDTFKNHDDIVQANQDVSLTSGIASVNVGANVGLTLSDSDFALTQAASGGAYSVKEKTSTSLSLPQGKIQWRSWLERCIDDGSFFLVYQKVLDTSDLVIHHEVFVRLNNDDGDTVPAGMFMPMANALGLGEQIDCAVFQMMKQFISTQRDMTLALNLTVSVFIHADALVEFNQLLKSFQNSTTKLCVEASHTIIDLYPAMSAEVADEVRAAGHSFGVDNLNLGRSLQTLQAVRPDYVKVNAKAIYDMTTGHLSAGYQALRTLTRALDIRLIAVAVDSQELYDHLKDLGVDSMQGNLLSQTEEMK